MFVALLLWGFVAGEDGLKFASMDRPIKYLIGIVIVIAVIVATLWATGVEGAFFDLLFRQKWSTEFWTNFAFVAVIIIALAAVLKKQTS